MVSRTQEVVICDQATNGPQRKHAIFRKNTSNSQTSDGVISFNDELPVIVFIHLCSSSLGKCGTPNQPPVYKEADSFLWRVAVVKFW